MQRRVQTFIMCVSSVFVSFCQKDQEPISIRDTSRFNASSCSFAELDSLSLTAIFDRQGNKLPDSAVNSDQVAWTLLSSETAPSFTGLGRYGNCSGSLIETKGTDPDAPAYILTNGHCVGSSLLDPDEQVFDRSEAVGKKMYFNYFQERVAAGKTTVFAAKTIAYASMNQTDVAVVELNATLADLKAQGLCAYALAKSRPQPGEALFIAGVPLSGISQNNLGLHLAHCSVGETVAVHEGEYRFLSSFRHRCSIVGGNSGSGILSRASKTIVGIVNTAVNDSAADQPECSLDRPCEVNEAGETSTHASENYAQYVDFLAGCFTSAGFFDASLESCGIESN